jgi:hypothetical protein
MTEGLLAPTQDVIRAIDAPFATPKTRTTWRRA